jgi:uncharacterized repeat protein (TIGR04052 family)
MLVQLRRWQAAIGFLALWCGASTLAACDGDDDEDDSSDQTSSRTSSRTSGGSTTSSRTSSSTTRSSGSSGSSSSSSSSSRRRSSSGSHDDETTDDSAHDHDQDHDDDSASSSGTPSGSRRRSSSPDDSSEPKMDAGAKHDDSSDHDGHDDHDDTDGTNGDYPSSSGPDGTDTPPPSTGGTSDSYPVSIEFRAVVDGVAFSCGDTYPGIGTQKTTVTPLDLRLFVQDLKLVRKDGTSVPVKLDVRKPWQNDNVALLDFEDATGNCSDGTREVNNTITGIVPPGEYVGVAFKNGVPEELNHVDPTAQADPLQSFSKLSWGWLGGYRFAKIELMEVVPPNGTGGTGILHVGATGCSGDQKAGTVACTRSNRNDIVINDFDPDLDVILLDIAPLFAKADLTGTAECHATGEQCKAMFTAFGLDIATGKADKTQAIYSVK